MGFNSGFKGLIQKHLKAFVKFTNEIALDKLNEVTNPA